MVTDASQKPHPLSENYTLKVTVHVGMDQNIKIEIFAECEYTLNELPVKFFSIRLVVCEIQVWQTLLELLPEVNCLL